MHPNSLIREKSPYLLQHARNPVSWQPWRPRAFRLAAEEDKPVFLSIGYSTCHWCHVMARESFEDKEVAALMNEAFICIKVDREERPDIDSVYMQACQLMTGSGGWPLTIIMTPDKKPFFAATYIPKQSHFGRTGMLELIPRVQELWKTKRADILRASQEVLTLLREPASCASGQTPGILLLHNAYNHLASSFDSRHGGFGAAQKFPSPHIILFLLRYWKRTGTSHSLAMAEKTLDAMLSGGIHDQIGGGFHRYATDPAWRVPHFEKMLYDQAMLVMAYTEAWQVLKKDAYREAVFSTVAYVLRSLTSPEGGFYCAEDAESQGEEGMFYLWDMTEIQKVLTPDEAGLIAAAYGLSEEGNFRDESTGMQTGRNILYLRRPLHDLAAERNLTLHELSHRLGGARAKLAAAREKRPRPRRDDKILADWNGLMIAACALAGRVFDSSRFTGAAEQAAGFILKKLLSRRSTLLHRYRLGHAAVSGLADDYAFMIWGLLELYEATFTTYWLQSALSLNASFISRFRDRKSGGFYTASHSAEKLPARTKSGFDGALPSANAAAALNLLRLSRITGNTDFEETAAHALSCFSGSLSEAPSSHCMFMCALDYAAGPTSEVVLSGIRGSDDTQAMLRAFHQSFLPNALLLFRPAGEDLAALSAIAPRIALYTPADGRATAYVCRGFSCDAPTTDVDAMLKLLDVKK